MLEPLPGIVDVASLEHNHLAKGLEIEVSRSRPRMSKFFPVVCSAPTSCPSTEAFPGGTLREGEKKLASRNHRKHEVRILLLKLRTKSLDTGLNSETPSASSRNCPLLLETNLFRR